MPRGQTPKQDRIANLLFANGPMTLGKLAELMQANPHAVRYLLQCMRIAKRARPSGIGRQTQWELI